MNTIESARESRLRAACDRCHDLKNRCVRTGGIDSRCDRCERLDIDCVYRNTLRIGRPRTTQRRASTISRSQLHSSESTSRQEEEARDGNHRRVPSKRSFEEIAGSSVDASTVEEESRGNGNSTLIGSPSDVMSLLVTPNGEWQGVKYIFPGIRALR